GVGPPAPSRRAPRRAVCRSGRGGRLAGRPGSTVARRNRATSRARWRPRGARPPGAVTVSATLSGLLTPGASPGLEEPARPVRLARSPLRPGARLRRATSLLRAARLAVAIESYRSPAPRVAPLSRAARRPRARGARVEKTATHGQGGRC